jgi:hypothetical protein
MMNPPPFAVDTVDADVREIAATAGGVFDRYTPQFTAGVVAVVSQISVIDGAVLLFDHVPDAPTPNAAMIRLSELAGVADGVGTFNTAVVPNATPAAPVNGVVVSQLPAVIAMTQPAHPRAVPIVQLNVSPPTAVFRTTSIDQTVPSTKLRTDVDPDGRVDGTVPFDPHAIPINRSPTANPAGMVGENVVTAVDPVLVGVPVDRTVAVTAGRRSRTTPYGIPRR